MALLREQLEEPGFEGSTATKQDELVSRLLSLATDGDVAAIRLVFAYVEGQPVAWTEQGEPGAFGDPLEDIPIETLRKALKLIK